MPHHRCEGQLVGAEISRSHARTVADPGGAPTPCSPTAEGPPDPVGEALDACDVAILPGIDFDTDEATLRSDATPALEQVLAALEDRPDLAGAIEGHTDGDGSDAYDLELSPRRAEAAVAWLVDRGFAVDRLTPVGVGEGDPIADSASDAGRAANRRVELEPLC